MRRAARVCPKRGCTNLVRGRQRYCDECEKERQRGVNSRRPEGYKDAYGPEWQAIRDAFIAEHPLCSECGQPATEVHHIVSLKDGGTHDWSNLASMCKRHHSRHTAKSDGGFGNPR